MKRKGWRLVVVLLLALLIVCVPPALAGSPELEGPVCFVPDAQGGCRQETVYTCVVRGYRRVCGYLTYMVCWPGYVAPQSYWTRPYVW